MVMKSSKKIIVAVAIILVMCLPIAIDAINNSILKTIKYKDLEDAYKATAKYEFTLVYVAPKSNEDTKDKKSTVKEVTSKYKSSYGKALGVYYMDYDKLTDAQKTDIMGDTSHDGAYMFVVNGEVLKTITEDINEDELDKYVAFYSNNIKGEDIPEEMKTFKVAKDAKSFQKTIKRKNDVTMAVFGKDTCFYCNQFKLVYNTVAEEYDVDDIYYFDSGSYDEKEYKKIMDMGLKIPATCSKTGKEVDLQTGFDTPLTLFIKNGKTIDCINGYSNKSTLITKLETVGMIKESK